MRPEDWQRINEVFLDALQKTPDQREAYLQEALADSPALRQPVEELLRADEQAGEQHFLETSCPLNIKSQLSTDQTAPLPAGHRFGPYEIQELIGTGGMGSVYRAVRVDDYELQVALKVVRGGQQPGQIQQRFANERQILAGLNHPNIARLLDGGTNEDGLLYLVMEHVNGAPIHTYCDTHKLSAKDIVKLFVQVCEAVNYAHQRFVIHRDLKPANILVNESGEVKVLDFGIARVLDVTPDAAQSPAADQLTIEGQPIGTPAYMSPEQISGPANDIDIRSDVYSLGVVGYFLLSGALPYEVKGHSLPEVSRIINEQAPVPLSQQAPQCRGELNTIFAKALEKDKARRYQTALELADDLNRYLHNEPIRAKPASVFYKARKFAQRNKILVGSVAAVVLFLVVTNIALYFAFVAEQRRQFLEKDSFAKLARLEMQRGEWEQAEQHINQALAFGHPEAIKLRLERIQIWSALHKLDAIEQELEALSNEAVPPELQGLLLLRRGDYLATKDMDKGKALIETSLSHPLPAAEQAYAKGHLAKTMPEAETHYLTAMKNDANHQAARGAAAYVLLFQGKFPEARLQVMEGETLYPNDPNFQVIKAMLTALQGDLPGARQILQSVQGQLADKDFTTAEFVTEAFAFHHNMEKAWSNEQLVRLQRRLLAFKMLRIKPNPTFGLDYGGLRIPPIALTTFNHMSAGLFGFLMKHPGANGPDPKWAFHLAQCRKLNPNEGSAAFLDANRQWEQLHGEGRWNKAEAIPQLQQLERDFIAAASMPAIFPVKALALDHAIAIAGFLGENYHEKLSEKETQETRSRAGDYVRTRISECPLNQYSLWGDKEIIFTRSALNANYYDLARLVIADIKKLTPESEAQLARETALVDFQSQSYYLAIKNAEEVLANRKDDEIMQKLIKQAKKKLQEVLDR